MAVGPDGTVYVTDHFNYCVRAIEEGQSVGTAAGVGFSAGTGAGTQATSTSLPEVCGIAVHRPTGKVYFTTTVQAHLVQSFLKDQLATIAGYGVGHGDGADGQATSTLIYPWWFSSVAVDAEGSVYFTDSLNHKVRKIPAGSQDVKTIAGGGPATTVGHSGQATSICLQHPAGIAVDAAGTVYFAEKDGHRVRKLVGQDLTTFAGTGAYDFTGDGGDAVSATFRFPAGVAVDRWNNVYVADHYNQRVRRITNGKITTVAGSATDTVGDFSGDGQVATAAKLNYPLGVAVDDFGNLYIADYHNNRVRKVWRAAEMGLPPKNLADLWPEPVGPMEAVQNQVITLGARVHNRGPATADGSKVTVTMTLPPGMIYGAAGVTPQRTFPGYQLAPGAGTLDGTFPISVLPSCPPGRYKVTVHVSYEHESNPVDNSVDFDVFVLAAKTDTIHQDGQATHKGAEKGLIIWQKEAPTRAKPGERDRYLHVAIAAPDARPVNPGDIPMSFTTPKGFVFTGNAQAAYYGVNNTRGTSQELTLTYSADHKSATTTANPHLNTTTSDREVLLYSLEVQAESGAAKGEHNDGEARIGDHDRVTLSGEIV